MAAYDLVSFDGNSIGPGTSYDFFLNADDAYVRTASVETVGRRSSYPTVGSTALDPRTLLIHGSKAGTAITDAVFRSNVQNWFDPNENPNGPRHLVMVGDDGSTNIRLACYVVDLTYIGQGVDQYAITLFAPRPIWEAVSATTSSNNPATVSNAGNVAVHPTITLTTGTHVTRRATTISDNTGRGLIAYPVRALLSATGATTANTFVYINGVSVPTYVEDSGLSTSAVWFLADVPADGSNLNVDIIYGTGLVNPIGGTLPSSGFDFDSSSNTAWVWNDWSVSDHASRCGVWRLAQTGEHESSTYYKVSAETTSNVAFAGSASLQYVNDADGIVLPVGAQAGTSSALSGMTRAFTRTGGNGAVRIDYRVAGSARWVNAWEVINTVSTTVSTSVDLDNAVEIRAYLWAGSSASAIGLDISGTTTLTLANTPTVTVGSAANMDYYNGTYVIGDYTITFDNLIVSDGTLTIDCEAKAITTSVAGPQYGDDTPSFSDPDHWVLIEPDVNTVTDGLSATDVVAFNAGYS
jgi:hypothetical protein